MSRLVVGTALCLLIIVSMSLPLILAINDVRIRFGFKLQKRIDALEKEIEELKNERRKETD